VVVTAALISVALGAAVLALGRALLYAGSRAGDRPDDAALSDVRAEPGGAAIRFTVTNRGSHAVLIGASLRRRSLRLRCEAGLFVTVPRRTSRGQLLASLHTVVCVVDAGEAATVLVPVPLDIPRLAELVVAVGEADRLRVVHRAIDRGSQRPSAPPEAAPLPLTQPS
jgi:hypothetical protein